MPTLRPPLRREAPLVRPRLLQRGLLLLERDRRRGARRASDDPWRDPPRLEAGGLLCLLAHNLDAPRKSPYEFRGLVATPNPLAAIRENVARIRRYARDIINHRRIRAREVREEQYSIINDQSNGFRLLAYYITRAHQVRQLEEAGFDRVEILDQQGNYISDTEPCDDGWIYYVARKSAACA